MSALFVAIVLGTAATFALLLAVVAEYISSNSLVTSIAGAFGGLFGQYTGRWIAGSLIPSDNERWLSNREYNSIFLRDWLLHCVLASLGLVLGLLLGFLTNRRSS